MKKLNDDEYSAGMSIIIFIHHYSQPNVSFDSLLIEQVLLGNFECRAFLLQSATLKPNTEKENTQLSVHMPLGSGPMR